MLGIISGLAAFFVVIGVGALLVRCGALPAGSDTIATRICFYAATPALLVTTVARANLSTLLSPDTVAGLLAEVIGVLSAGAVHRWVLHRSLAESTIGALAAGYVNAANLGIPVLILLLGTAAPIAPILLLQLLVLAPVSFAILDWCVATGRLPGGGQTHPSKIHLWTAPLRNPLLIAVLVGLIINLAGWDMSHWLAGFVVASLEQLGVLAVPLMMLSLGMSVAASSPKVTRRLTIQQVARLQQPTPATQATASQPAAQAGIAQQAATVQGEVTQPETSTPSGEFQDVSERGPVLWVSVLWKLAVVPVLAVLIGLALGLRGAALLTPVTTAALPCAQNVFMYATRYGAAKPLARDCVLLTTVGFVPVVLLATALLRGI